MNASWKEAAYACATVVVVLAALIWRYMAFPGFFYQDDVQHYYAGLIIDIVGQLERGSFPVITLSSWTAGWLDAEWGLALYNPFTLASYWLFFNGTDFSLASGLFVGTHMAVMALGAYALARRFGVTEPFAMLVATAYCMNPLITYWYAASWWNGLMAMAWLPWSLTFLTQAGKGTGYFLGAVFFTYLQFASGWVHGVMVTSILVFLWIATMHSDRVRDGLPVLFAWLAATLLLISIILPLIHFRELFYRVSGFFNAGFLTADLGSLLLFSMPFVDPFMLGFSGYGQLGTPVTYAAWFIFPALLLVGKEVYREHKAAVVFLAAASLILALAAMGPSQMGPTRWPFRFIPYMHLCLLLLAGIILSSPVRQPYTRSRKKWMFAGWVLLAVLSAQNDPSRIVFYGGLALLLGIVSMNVFHGKITHARTAAWGLLTLVVLFVCGGYLFPGNPQYGNYGAPVASDVSQSPMQSNSGNTLVSGSTRGQGYSGNMLLLRGRNIVNGYSPTPNKPLRDALCLDWSGLACERSARYLFKQDPVSLMLVADLYGINEIFAERGTHEQAFRRVLPDNWTISPAQNDFDTKFVRFVRSSPVNNQGTMTWHSPGLRVESNGGAPDEEMFSVVSGLRAGQCGDIVLARPYNPGYRAYLAKRQVDVNPYIGTLTAIHLCGSQQGRLVLKYSMPGMNIRALLWAMVLLIVVTYAWRLRRLNLRGGESQTA